MSDLKEAVEIFLTLSDEAKTYVVNLLKSGELPDDSQAQYS